MAATTSGDASNVLGALLFFSYIIAALSLTGVILYDLLQLYKAHPDGERQHDDTKSPITATPGARSPTTASPLRLGLSVLLAALSFTMLSYHMLFFLIRSYNDYCRAHSLPLPLTPMEAAGALIGSSKASPPLYIWTWATHSILFQDFAYSILSKPVYWWWTQKALLFSFAWNCIMAQEGAKHSIPRLWAHFILDQILPVSFTQNLFLLATQLSRTTPTTKLRYPRPWTHYSLTLAYLACLYAAPKSINTPYFFPILFATRALLFAPYILLRPSKAPPGRGTTRNEDKHNDGLILFMIGAVILDVVQSLSLLSTPSLTSMPSLASINDNHAVSTLWYDFLIGMGSLVVHWAPI